jgi:GNAT superfamily N-acetyltransferase
MVAQMIEVAPVTDEADEQRSLDTYLETWPHESYGLAEVQAFKASLLDHADLLAREDGAVLGCGFVALFHGLPESPRVMLTVPPRNRGRGAGTALYAAISDWARSSPTTTRAASRSPGGAASSRSGARRASRST